MPRVKTAENDNSVDDFLNEVADPQRRRDSYILHEMMLEITGLEPKMWGSSIVGYGSYHYKYDSGREGEWFLTGFSPRKQSPTLYIMPGFDRYSELMEQLGKHKLGKSCLYIKKLTDVDHTILRELIAQSVAFMNQKYKREGEA